MLRFFQARFQLLVRFTISDTNVIFAARAERRTGNDGDLFFIIKAVRRIRYHLNPYFQPTEKHKTRLSARNILSRFHLEKKQETCLTTVIFFGIFFNKRFAISSAASAAYWEIVGALIVPY